MSTPTPPFQVPEVALVVLIGPSGAGKSTFAAKHFLPTEVVSSDRCRGAVSDDDNDQDASADAFELLHHLVRLRLKRGRLTVVDATNVLPEARASLVALAREFHVFAVAIAFDLPEKVCIERNKARPNRDFGAHVVRNHAAALRRSLRGLEREGFRYVHRLGSVEEVDTATIERTRLWTNRQDHTGPFDLIGDVHGCWDELEELLGCLGWKLALEGGTWTASHPEGRTLVFVGDLVDRGPKSAEVLHFVMDACAAGVALCVAGNHEAKLVKKLRGRDVKIAHGLQATLDSLATRDPAFSVRAERFMDSLLSHYVLDGRRLVVAHAGLPEHLQGRTSATVRAFAMYGETTGEIDEYGLPVRLDWARDYRGRATVVHGHVPVPEAEWLNQTIDIDTGCCFGGRLTALRYPERELVQVNARQVWFEPTKPLRPPSEQTAQQDADAWLDLGDVSGRCTIHTGVGGNVAIAEENAAAALETMSRFAVDPRWLVTLPPTMSPPETSARPGLLEHPDEVFAYFARRGVPAVICEEKHMGSRAIVVICRDEAAARRRFAVPGGDGVVYTRTGRRFFEDPATEAAILGRVRAALDAAGTWELLATDWVVLDCELLPWSAKAQALLRGQYAPVGVAASAAASAALALLDQASAAGLPVGALRERAGERASRAARYGDAWRRYCWTVRSPDDLAIAPFHLLASEGAVHVDKDHLWHMAIAAKLAETPGMRETRFTVVHLADPAQLEAGVRFWETLTGQGGEGMVTKPLSFVSRGRKGLDQPALKCRGPEYLRLIYGPEYDAPANLERLRQRGLSSKRHLAIREFALGIEALQRFARREPLRRVHACAFGVLALESEPVDPRL